MHGIRQVIDDSPDPIFSVDRDLRLSYANRAFAGLTHKSIHRILGSLLSELGLPAGASDVLESAARSALETRTRQEFEIVLPANGPERRYHVQFSANRAGEGSDTAVIGVLRDVTDLLRERDLRLAEQAFRKSLEDSLLVGIATIDLEGRHDYVNPAFCRMVGMSAGQLEGAAPPFPYWPPEERERLGRALGSIMAGEEASGSLETVFARPDGARVDVQICWRELRDGSGARTGWVGSFGNISAVKSREREVRELNEGLEARVRERTADLAEANRQLAAAKEEIESFSRTVIHDVGNQAVVVGMLARRLKRLHDSGNFLEEAAPIDTIRAQALRIEELMRDLGKLLRAGKVELAPAAVDLSAVAREVADNLPRREGGPDVAWAIADGVTALGDPRLLRILLENLLGNAWKFTHGVTSPSIEFGRSPDGDFFVRDNGCGFDPSVASKIFEPFRRLHDDDGIGGTGMGLAIVERIVSRHGGRIWAEGTPGHGACIHFALPGAPEGFDAPCSQRVESPRLAAPRDGAAPVTGAVITRQPGGFMNDEKKVSYEVSLRFEAVKLPPVTDVLVLGKDYPHGKNGVLMAFEYIAPDQFEFIDLPEEHPVAAAILIAKRLTKRIPTATLLQLLEENVFPYISSSETIKVDMGIVLQARGIKGEF